MAEDKELAEEGMLLIGDKGKILGGFRGDNPQLIPESKMRSYRAENHIRSQPRAKVRAVVARLAPQGGMPHGLRPSKAGLRAMAISSWPGPFAMR